MRVIHLACIAPPEIGGIGRVASTEVELLRARGIDATLLSSTTHRLIWRFGNAAALDLRPVMEELRNADIVHLHYPYYGTAGRIARLREQKIVQRLVITFHMDAIATSCKNFIFNIHRKIAQPRILQTADALFVSSLEYARHSSIASLADRCIELPFGVDEKIFFPPTSPPTPSPNEGEGVNHRALKCPPNEGGLQGVLSHGRDESRPCNLLFVGGMDRAHAFKGVEILLRAMTLISQSAKLTLIGDGDLRSQYEELAQQLRVADRVQFVGRVSEQELPDVYRSADLFIFPSTSGAEAFGLAALEAQACGVPVVASDLPGVRTVIKHGETGFLVPPKNAHALAERISYLLEHADLRRKMGMSARERVLERFTWTTHADQLMKIYQNLCASRS